MANTISAKYWEPNFLARMNHWVEYSPSVHHTRLCICNPVCRICGCDNGENVLSIRDVLDLPSLSGVSPRCPPFCFTCTVSAHASCSQSRSHCLLAAWNCWLTYLYHSPLDWSYGFVPTLFDAAISFVLFAFSPLSVATPAVHAYTESLLVVWYCLISGIFWHGGEEGGREGLRATNEVEDTSEYQLSIGQGQF